MQSKIKQKITIDRAQIPKDTKFHKNHKIVTLICIYEKYEN